MKRRPQSISVCRRLLWLCLVAPVGVIIAADEARPWFGAGKPGAPVDVRWEESGQHGRVSVAVTPGIDYERLELRLLIPGLDGPPAPMLLSGGKRGVVRRAAWYLAAPPAVTPRLLVILETDGQRLGRTVAAPDLRGSRALAQPASTPASDRERIIDMPAQEQRGVAEERLDQPE